MGVPGVKVRVGGAGRRSAAGARLLREVEKPAQAHVPGHRHGHVRGRVRGLSTHARAAWGEETGKMSLTPFSRGKAACRSDVSVADFGECFAQNLGGVTYFLSHMNSI